MNFWENSNRYGQNDVGQSDVGREGARGDHTRGDAYGLGGMSPEFAERLNSFAGKSEDGLMDELVKKTAALKAEGAFDPVALDRLYATASPFLSETQRERMRAIIEMLKRG